MKVARLAEGLWRWTATHPEWTPASASPAGWDQQVGCVFLETSRGIVLVDPLVPAASTESVRFWMALEQDVARAKGVVHVLVTTAWHGRSADAIRERLGASVHAHVDALPDILATVTLPFRGLDARLPCGIRAWRLEPCAGGEVLYELPRAAGLCFGDALSGIGEGRARICPTSWAPEKDRTTFQARLRGALRPHLERRFRRLLVSHGEPVLERGRAALAEALEAAPQVV